MFVHRLPDAKSREGGQSERCPCRRARTPGLTRAGPRGSPMRAAGISGAARTDTAVRFQTVEYRDFRYWGMDASAGRRSGLESSRLVSLTFYGCVVSEDWSQRHRSVPGDLLEIEGWWLPLAEAAKALGMARQTVLPRVQRGELDAV